MTENTTAPQPNHASALLALCYQCEEYHPHAGSHPSPLTTRERRVHAYAEKETETLLLRVSH